MERLPDSGMQKHPQPPEPERTLTMLGSIESSMTPNRTLQKWTDGVSIVYFSMRTDNPVKPEEINVKSFDRIRHAAAKQRAAYESLTPDQRLDVELQSMRRRGQSDNPGLRYAMYRGQQRAAVEFAESIQANVGVRQRYH